MELRQNGCGRREVIRLVMAPRPHPLPARKRKPHFLLVVTDATPTGARLLHPSPEGLVRHIQSVLETGDLLKFDCKKEGGSKNPQIPLASSAEQSGWRWDHPGTPRVDAAPEAATWHCWRRPLSGVFLLSTSLPSCLSWTVSSLPQCMTGTKKQLYFWQTHLSHSPRAGGCSKWLYA